MVRLKVGMQYIKLVLAIKFQFQNGSIKRIEKEQKAAAIALFQFQNGSIKSVPD